VASELEQLRDGFGKSSVRLAEMDKQLHEMTEQYRTLTDVSDVAELRLCNPRGLDVHQAVELDSMFDAANGWRTARNELARVDSAAAGEVSRHGEACAADAKASEDAAKVGAEERARLRRAREQTCGWYGEWRGAPLAENLGGPLELRAQLARAAEAAEAALSDLAAACTEAVAARQQEIAALEARRARGAAAAAGFEPLEEAARSWSEMYHELLKENSRIARKGRGGSLMRLPGKGRGSGRRARAAAPASSTDDDEFGWSRDADAPAAAPVMHHTQLRPIPGSGPASARASQSAAD